MIGMTALLAGLGQGYLDGKRRQRDDDRQDEADRQRKAEFDARQEERAFQKAERDRAVKTRDAVAEAYAPVTAGEEQLPGPTQPDEASLPVAAKAGNRFYTSMAEANAAADAENAPGAQAERAAGAYLKMGDVAGARKVKADVKQDQLTDLQLRTAIEQARNEGTGQALADVLSGLPPEQVLQRFNQAGGVKLKSLTYEPFETEHPVLGKTKSARVVGVTEDGKQFEVPDAVAASFNLFKAEKRFEMLTGAKKDAAGEADKAAGRTHQTATLTETTRHNQVMEGVYGRQADASMVRAERPAAGASVDRMDEPDKLVYQGLQKQRGAVEKRMGSIEDAILKAQADGMWDEAAPNAVALRGQLKKLQQDLGALTVRESTLMRKYQQAAPADPYGLRSNPGAPAATIRPATPMEAVRQDMAASGVQAADIDVQGVRARVGPPAVAPAAGAAPARPMASMADRIPGSGGVQAPLPTGGAPAAAAPAPAAPQGFQQFLAANIATPQGKSAILRRVRTELPQLQQAILADAQVLQNPSVTPEVKATLQARIAANQATAEMMQRFVDGNPGLVPA